MSVISESYEALKDYPILESAIGANDFAAAQAELRKALASIGPKIRFVPSKTYQFGGMVGMVTGKNFIMSNKDYALVDTALTRLNSRSKRFRFTRDLSFGKKVAIGGIGGAAVGMLGAPQLAPAAGFSAAVAFQSNIYAEYK